MSKAAQLQLFTPAETTRLPEPIAAKCKKCGFDAVGEEAIVALSLAGCACFWCHGELRPHRGERDFRIKDRHEDTAQGRAWEKHQRILQLCEYAPCYTGRLEQVLIKGRWDL